jgi:hypothetical protein
MVMPNNQPITAAVVSERFGNFYLPKLNIHIISRNESASTGKVESLRTQLSGFVRQRQQKKFWV